MVEIEEIRVAGSARTGDSFEILVRYTTHLDLPASVSFRIPAHVSFPGRSADVRSIREDRRFSPAQTRTERFRVRADASGTGLYMIHFEMPESPDEYNPTVQRWIKIYTTEDGFDLFDPLNPGDREPKEIGKDIQTFIGERPDNEKRKMENMQLQSGYNYNVSVSGKIRFFSGFPEFTNRGVYKNGVVLWFRNSSDPGTWFHPVVGNIQGTHFDKLDADGNFSFNFSFTGDLSGYDEVIVLANAGNDAAFMPAPLDGYVSYHGGGYTAYYHESDGITASINPSQTTISVIQENNNFPPNHGKVYRHLQQSKEYVEALYDGNLPFSLPAIYTRILDLSGAAGVFCSSTNCEGYSAQSYGPYIFIDPITGSQIKTISHEYGHNTNFRMWNSSSSKMNDATLSLKEGWAEFFSFGLRNYANRNFGDDLLSNRTNAEEAAFNENNRYSGFSYLSTDRSVAAFGSYLWNLYDATEDQTFLAAQYSQGDNDDISGHSVRVFEKMRSLGTTTISTYHSHFKSGLPLDEQTSINSVYDFMFDDLHAIPQAHMRSAQVDNFQKNIHSGSIDFTWEANSYPSQLDYSNPETGYRLYRDTGSGWTLIQTLNAGVDNFTYSPSGIYGEYKFTSYNPEGNSSSSPTLSVQPPEMSVSLSGPAMLLANSFPAASYQASVTDGESPLSYQWWKQQVYESGPEGPWTLLSGVSGSTYFFFPGDPEIFNLRVDVTDDLNRTESDQMQVEIVGPSGSSTLSASTDTPESFDLAQNYPNPFNPSSTIRFALPERADVTLTVYNMLGQRVATLVDGEVQPGRHDAIFDASALSSGNYIARFTAIGISGDTYEQSFNMQLVK